MRVGVWVRVRVWVSVRVRVRVHGQGKVMFRVSVRVLKTVWPREGEGLG